MIYLPWHFPLQLDTTIQGASKKAERAFSEQYPAVYVHMSKYKKQLASRNKVETGIRYEWYALQRWGTNYWSDFDKPVIAWQRITAKNQFCLTKAGTVILDSMAFLSNLGKYSKMLLAFLNSNLIYFWMKMNVHEYGDSGFRLSNQYVENFPIPRLADTKEIDALVDKIVDCHADKSTRNDGVGNASRNDADTSELEKQIDARVYELYGLTAEEIATVERK